MALVSKAFSKGGDKIDFVDNFPLMGLQFGASGFRHPIYKLSAEQKSFAFPIWCLFYLSCYLPERDCQNHRALVERSPNSIWYAKFIIG